MKLRLLGAVCVLLASTNQYAYAAVIHETALQGVAGLEGSGSSLTAMQYVGSRFSLAESVRVTHVGGHIGRMFSTIPHEPIEGDIFAALVPLPSAAALPVFEPTEIESSSLAHVVFSPTLLSSDMLVPLSITLSAGDYALVFGGGWPEGLSGTIDAFGTTGAGAMPRNNQGLPGASLFASNCCSGSGNIWVDVAFTNERFVVHGEVVPIPPALYLFGSGLLGLAGVAKRRHKVTVRASNR